MLYYDSIYILEIWKSHSLDWYQFIRRMGEIEKIDNGPLPVIHQSRVYMSIPSRQGQALFSWELQLNMEC